jgi:chromosome segregation and condensation protein ScpB
LIAYQPGITKSSIESQWGQPVGGILANLIKRGLVRMDSASHDAHEEGDFQLEAQPSGPAQAPRYFTTDRFLAILGLESLEDLPRGDEL